MLTNGRCLPPHLPGQSSVAPFSHGWMPVAGRTMEMPGRTIKVRVAGRTKKMSMAGRTIEAPTAGRTMANGSYMGQTQRIMTAAKASATLTVTVTGTSSSLAWSPDPTTREPSGRSRPVGRDRVGAARRSTIGV